MRTLPLDAGRDHLMSGQLSVQAILAGTPTAPTPLHHIPGHAWLFGLASWGATGDVVPALTPRATGPEVVEP